MNEEILFITHKKSRAIKRLIRSIRDQMGDRSLTVISQSIPFNIEGTNFFQFNESIVREMDFPAIGDSLVPGNVYFPVFSYIQQQESPPDFYWIIEYDVRFTGRWAMLFDHYAKYDADLITSHIRGYPQEPDWYWWEMNHPQENIPKEKRLRSFSPIYRISHRAYQFLRKKLESGWCGHYEVTFPTLLHHNGFKLLDLAGNGKFYNSDRNFSLTRSDREGALLTGTMKYRPAMKKPGFRINKLYHPVKEDGLEFLRLYAGNVYRYANWLLGIPKQKERITE